MCSIRLDPCREDHTICTAVAFDAVRTVRTYATDEGYGPGLVHKLWPAKPFQPSKHGTTLTRPRSNDRSQVGFGAGLAYAGQVIELPAL